MKWKNNRNLCDIWSYLIYRSEFFSHYEWNGIKISPDFLENIDHLPVLQVFCNNYDFRIISEFQIHRLWKNFQLGKKMTSPIFTQLVTSIFFYKNVLCFFNTYLKDLWGNQGTMSHIKKCIMNWCLTYCIFFSYIFPSSLHFLLEIGTGQERIFFT